MTRYPVLPETELLLFLNSADLPAPEQRSKAVRLQRIAVDVFRAGDNGLFIGQQKPPDSFATFPKY